MAVIVAFGDALIVTDLLLDEELHPPELVMTTEIVMVPELPAVNRMLFVELPEVIEPLVMVHVYLAPLPALGTDAVLPAEAAQTETGIVKVAVG